MNILTRAATAAAIATVLVSGAQAATIAVMNGSHDVINGTVSGHLGLNGLGHTSTLFADSAGGYTAALASGADALVIEQGGESAASAAALTAYMTAGGRVIMLGGSGSGLYNSLFGASTTFEFDFTGESFAKQAAATGTTFGDDAAALIGLSSHHEAETGLPGDATVYYGGAGDAIVFSQNVGSGDFIYLGWDYCCGGTTSQANDWYGVLDSAIAFTGPAPAPAPATLVLAAFGLLASGSIARRRRMNRDS